MGDIFFTHTYMRVKKGKSRNTTRIHLDFVLMLPSGSFERKNTLRHFRFKLRYFGYNRLFMHFLTTLKLKKHLLSHLETAQDSEKKKTTFYNVTFLLPKKNDLYRDWDNSYSSLEISCVTVAPFKMTRTRV